MKTSNVLKSFEKMFRRKDFKNRKIRLVPETKKPVKTGFIF